MIHILLFGWSQTETPGVQTTQCVLETWRRVHEDWFHQVPTQGYECLFGKQTEFFCLFVFNLHMLDILVKSKSQFTSVRGCNITQCGNIQEG